jgi:FkbM family methyltransferase
MVDRILLDCYDININNTTFLECGAHFGEETSYINSIVPQNCFYIEANPTDFKYLNKVNKYNYALTDYNGDIEFTVTSHGGNSSVCHSQEHIDELRSYGSTFQKIKVPCITYQYFIEKIINKKINILILDIEGHENVILNHMKTLNIEYLPDIIVIECGYDWTDRKISLKELGYTIDFYNFNNCYLSHTKSNIHKKNNNINLQNKNNKNFIWSNKIIYENELEIKDCV